MIFASLPLIAITLAFSGPSDAKDGGGLAPRPVMSSATAVHFYDNLDRQGAPYSGWWGLLDEGAAAGGTRNIVSINFSGMDKPGWDMADGFWMSCNEGRLSVARFLPFALPGYEGAPDAPVVLGLQVDDNPATEHEWLFGKGKAFLVYDDAALSLLREAVNGAELTLTFTDKQGGMHRWSHRIEGMSQAANVIVHACS